MIRRTFVSRIASINEEFVETNWRPGQPDASGKTEWVCDKTSRGWFVRLDGSQEKMHWGDEEPVDVKVGDRIRVTMEKVE